MVIEGVSPPEAFLSADLVDRPVVGRVIDMAASAPDRLRHLPSLAGLLKGTGLVKAGQRFVDVGQPRIRLDEPQCQPKTLLDLRGKPRR
jgi:hypothetical protein